MKRKQLQKKEQENRHVIITVITISIIVLFVLFLLLGKQFVGKAIYAETAPVLAAGQVGLNPYLADFDPATGDTFTLNVEANLGQEQLGHYEVVIIYPIDRVVIVQDGVKITTPFSDTGFADLFPMISDDSNTNGLLRVTDSAMLSDEYLTGVSQSLFSIKFAVIDSTATSPIDITIQEATLLDESGNKLNNDNFVNSVISIVVPPAEICANGVDDDNNDLVDCADTACNGQAGCYGAYCQTDSSCADGYYCKVSSTSMGQKVGVTGLCVNKLAEGQSCLSDNQCASSSCTTANQGASFCCPADQCYSSISQSCVTAGSFIYSQASPPLICDAGTWSTDADADTVVDAEDNCPAVSNLGQEDLDGDGVGNLCDTDIDGDGISNVNELNNPAVGFGETANVDVDNDGLNNDYDLDSDGDGYSDYQETFEGLNSNPYGALSIPGDYDGDEVADASDNCFSTANNDQLNTDGDTQGDACDNDDDNDGVLDAVDNCPLTVNPDQTDTNDDGIGDACEATAPGSLRACNVDDDYTITAEVQCPVCGSGQFYHTITRTKDVNAQCVGGNNIIESSTICTNVPLCSAGESCDADDDCAGTLNCLSGVCAESQASVLGDTDNSGCLSPGEYVIFKYNYRNNINNIKDSVSVGDYVLYKYNYRNNVGGVRCPRGV